MFDDVTRTIEAWKCDRRSAGAAVETARTRAPHLRLQVIDDECDVLMVEIAEGTLDAREGLVYLQDRGVFEVAARLRRQGVGGLRLYLRLRPWRRLVKSAA